MQPEGLAAGTLVAGKYLVQRALGRGGMGAVYVVTHTGTGKRLAMKCLLAEYVRDQDLVARFFREAQVMGRLQHRHVVDVLDVGRDGDVLYIVMELLDGKPLSEVLQDSSLTLERALVILLRAMEGVSAAHDQGVIHRDLKPENIFVCVGASGRLDDPRVLDFGISKVLDVASDPLTRTGAALGTPYYMSLEQLRGERDLDARVDVYALGVILYEALTGEPPFLADTLPALAIKVITTSPTDLATLRPDLPAGLAAVVMKAISRERNDRQRSVRVLIEALRPFVPESAGLRLGEGTGKPLRTPRAPAGLAAAATRPAAVDLRGSTKPGATPAPAHPAGAPTPRTSGPRWLGIALVASALAGGAAWALRGQRSATPPLPEAIPAVPRAASEAPASAPVAAPHALGTSTMPPRAPVAARVEPEAPDAGEAVSGAHEPAKRTGRKPRVEHAGVAEPSAASSQGAASHDEPKPAATPVTGKRVTGRAGELGSDEF